MNNIDDPSVVNFSQPFRYLKKRMTRPKTSIPRKNASDMFRLGIQNRNLLELSSERELIYHNIYIPTDTGLQSPPPLFQPTPTPDLGSIADHVSGLSSPSPTPVRIKSASLTIPQSNKSKEIFSNNFPSQFHERRKLAEKRRQKKQQQLQRNVLDDSNTWFHLRQSLAELKRLATTEEILVDPSTSLFNCDGYSFEALKQAMKEQQEQKNVNRFKSDSGMMSSTETIHSYRSRPQTSASISQKSLTRPRSSIQRPIEIYSRSAYRPFLVSSKPLHPLLLTGNNRSLKYHPKQIKYPLSTPSPNSPFDDKHFQLTLSNLSNQNDQTISYTTSPILQNVQEDEHEDHHRQTSIGNTNSQRPSSTLSLKSTIKLKSQVPRCRSANESKQFNNKTHPRFILITDQEHRIESWYHQYPFIVSDDLIQAFQSKTNKSTVSAYFIDEQQLVQKKKTYLQGKSFHINNDWKKYDLIFISNNIYHDIIIYLQTILRLSGKLIHIYQLNHNEDLKTQVKTIYKQFSSHV